MSCMSCTPSTEFVAMISGNFWDSQEIADGMSFTKASIYYYYKSKDEILFDILSFADAEINILLTHEIEECSDPLEQVGRIVTAHVRWYLEHPDIARVSFRDWDELSDKFLTIQKDRRRRLGHLLRERIEACQHMGILSPASNVTLVANFINGAVAATNVWFNPDGPDKPASVAAAFGEMAQSIVLGSTGQ